MATFKAKFIGENWTYTHTLQTECVDEIVKEAKNLYLDLRSKNMLASNSILWEIYKDGNPVWDCVRGWK